uniref:RHOMBOID-like protein n=1 Tax=Alisma plantago-aquatica TaxID=15000 RepID=A0A0A7E6L9_ALIPL|nr:rhomboid protein Alipl6488 [Alisma plantago-aquatica]
MGKGSTEEASVLMSPERSRSSAQPVGSMPPPQPPARYVDVRPFRSWTPWLVPAIVVANIIVFIITMYVNNCPKKTGTCVADFLGRFAFQPFKENPLLGPSSTTLLKMGALQVSDIVHKKQGWRLISCIWLHGGVFHLLANMIGLLFIGIRLEQEFGFVRVGILYIISGIGGSLLSALFVQSNISVGASGALFGLLGGMLSELITNWTIYANKFAALTTLVFIIAINLAIGLLPRVDNFAHLGGFITGFLLGFVLLIRPHFGWVAQKSLPMSSLPSKSAKRKHKAYQYLLWIIAAILLTIGLIVGFILVFRGVDGNKHCSWCHYLNCIPTSKWSCKDSSSVFCDILTDSTMTNITCRDTGKSRSYPVSNPSSGQINSLCAQLCG